MDGKVSGDHKVVIVGLQWGDEGKGKIIDILAPGFDLVVRYQGGPNAGHTVHRGDRKIIFHQLPSGVLHPEVQNLIASGCVVDPRRLFEELEALKGIGIDTRDRVWVSKFAHVILPHHIAIDGMREDGKAKPLGTTRRGVGMCYEDKFARIGIRIGDLIAEDTDRLRYLISHKNFLLIELYGGEPLDDRRILKEYMEFGRRLRPLAVSDPYFLKGFQNRRILFESAQGTLLDISFGTYPYVTSSHPIVGGIGASIGMIPNRLLKIGIVKAYTTRVGLGPFPTEIEGELGEILRKKGNEYGSTTGRPRRIGWLDIPALRFAAIINGIDAIILTKLDVLSGLKEIKIGTGYQTDSGPTEEFDPTRDDLVPEYRSLPGWEGEIAGVKGFDQLPREAQEYVAMVEDLIGVRIVGISVGPEPDQMIWRERLI
ncbi:adenylosuccinate synthase [candidate division WOR-3 bacterium]|uniref:Adenylosuccinate synthetase n=1 Tax=candidate division WOR-3 bacterium TaxID=2052148 RepID=A0A660SGG4_UNCW3|nr:MAG: adenylosuccinate synthase [candidate division WOR-3 bacterium]